MIKRIMSNCLDLKIENIIEKSDCWIFDYFPKQIEKWKDFEWLEPYLLRKKNKQQYVSKVINIILKMIPYYNMFFYIGDVYKKRFKKFEGCYKKDFLKSPKILKVMRKLIENDETIIVLFEKKQMVISIGLYNTVIYSTENSDVMLIKSIVTSEGLFFRKACTEE